MNSREINRKYLDLMYNAKPNSDKVLHRVHEFWWPHFEKEYIENGISSLDHLDTFMDLGQARLQDVLEADTQSKGNGDSAKSRQALTQAVKSNSGKMFERFVGLSIAYSLHSSGSKYAIWPFRKDLKKVCSYLAKDYFQVTCQLGNRDYSTAIDCDLIVFDPVKPSEYYMLSIKTTLKDRFHNVPFWNLLRCCAIGEDFNLTTPNRDLLSQARYLGICSDLAKEQPDFPKADGPRKLGSACEVMMLA